MESRHCGRPLQTVTYQALWLERSIPENWKMSVFRGWTVIPARARGACPIGSLQAVIGSWNFKMAYYVAGFLIFVGALLGRLVCGFLCPFGLIQDLLNKIPFPKKIRTFRGDKLLRKLKYVIFLVFVIILPMFVVDIMGQGSCQYFCKLICPAGTLEEVSLWCCWTNPCEVQ